RIRQKRRNGTRKARWVGSPMFRLAFLLALLNVPYFFVDRVFCCSGCSSTNPKPALVTIGFDCLTVPVARDATQNVVGNTINTSCDDYWLPGFLEVGRPESVWF